MREEQKSNYFSSNVVDVEVQTNKLYRIPQFSNPSYFPCKIVLLINSRPPKRATIEHPSQIGLYPSLSLAAHSKSSISFHH